MKQMLLSKEKVKSLDMLEKLGQVDSIVTEKTGIFTDEKMKVVSIWAGKEKKLDTRENLAGKYDWSQFCDKNGKRQEILQQALSWNLQGTIYNNLNATEDALIRFADSLGISYDGTLFFYKGGDMTKFPFNSQRQRMSTILPGVAESESGKRIHMKGVPDKILDACDRWLNYEGEVEELDEKKKKFLLQICDNYSRDCMRTVCMAYKDLEPNEGGFNHEEKSDTFTARKEGIRKVEESGFICLAIVGIQNLFDPEVLPVVRECQKAEIEIRIFTGDSKESAQIMAQDFEIFDKRTPDHK